MKLNIPPDTPEDTPRPRRKRRLSELDANQQKDVLQRWDPLDTESLSTHLTFHPSKQYMFAASYCSGEFELNTMHTDERQIEICQLFNFHQDSCRVVEFSQDGTKCWSVSKDKSIGYVDVETGKVIGCYEECHESSIAALKVYDKNLIVTGDDDGCVRVWDSRCDIGNGNPSQFTFDEHTDFISAMECIHKKRILCVGSGDGRFSAWDMRKHHGKLISMSDNLEDSILSICLLKSGKKLCCGTMSGAINIFNWRRFEWYSDRFLGHAENVNHLIKFDEDCALTTCSDGLIRIVTLYPHRLLHVVGSHNRTAHALDIDAVAISHDNRFVISAASDQIVRVWDLDFNPNDIDFFVNGDESDVSDGMGGEMDDDDDDSDESGEWELLYGSEIDLPEPPKKKRRIEVEVSDESDGGGDNDDEDDEESDEDFDESNVRRIKWRKYYDHEKWVKHVRRRHKVRRVTNHDTKKSNARRFFRDLA